MKSACSPSQSSWNAARVSSVTPPMDFYQANGISVQRARDDNVLARDLPGHHSERSLLVGNDAIGILRLT
jgi:hypothetical protein